MLENSIFKTTWQLYNEIELHVAKLCTVDYAIVFQYLFTLKQEKTLTMHLHFKLYNHVTAIMT